MTSRRLPRRRLLALARAFDRAEARSTPWLHAERGLKARLRRRRRRSALYLTRAELVRLGEWKSARIRPRIARNTAAGVRGLTTAAFCCRDEERRLRLLQGLSGVGPAVASVILHFADPGRYPVYDVRVRTALRRLGVRTPFPPTPAGWVAYAACLRALARRRRVSLRTLDKALWLLGGPAP
jgi:3-methyladenine DNA glycosylase/8-oxoguanine DNA glycosylase